MRMVCHNLIRNESELTDFSLSSFISYSCMWWVWQKFASRSDITIASSCFVSCIRAIKHITKVINDPRSDYFQVCNIHREPIDKLHNLFCFFFLLAAKKKPFSIETNFVFFNRNFEKLYNAWPFWLLQRDHLKQD